MDNTAVVILNYNGIGHLKQFLPSVVEHSGDCSIVVIDNFSQDGSQAYLRSHFPQVTLITLDKNYGFSGGYNRGLQEVDARYYILLNSDVQVSPHWTGPLIQCLDSHPQVGICQPKILSYREKDRFDYAGAAGGFLDKMGYPFCRGRIFDHLEKDKGQYDEDCAIFWAGGACLVIRAAIFRELGGFDAAFFAHMEEIDLCWRAQRAGYSVAFVSSSSVYHLGGGTLADTNPYKTYLNFRNGLNLLLKNSAPRELVWKIPLRMLLDVLAAGRFLVMGSWHHFLAVLRAEVSFIKGCAGIWRKRDFNKLKHPVALYNKWIIWDYFIKGKKTFREISEF